jgi:glutamine amidotransferase
MKIGVVYYNMGNLRSVLNAFEKIGAKAQIVTEGEELKRFDKLFLPGVGAFGDAMAHLREHRLDEALREFAQTGRPLLGVCLGMQLLLEKSYEFGEHTGLGLIPGEVVRFDKGKMEEPLKIPQMGWNRLFPAGNSPLFEGVDSPYLYFVHSYHAVTDEKFVAGWTYYGYRFPSSLHYENIYGLQPHPEKSHRAGLQILKNFVEKC